jgi:predicted HD phosphohydrolase
LETQRSIVDLITDMLNDAGSESYGGEAVSQLEHALQAAVLAQEAGKDEEFVVACLLHDIGHLAEDARAGFNVEGDHKRAEAMNHGDAGAEFLDGIASERMRWLIAGHAVAKRYLCAVEPGYYERLSPVSKQTLEYQGGPMTPDEAAELERHPWFEDLILLRRIDDEAKRAGRETPGIQEFRPLLERQFGSAGAA